MTIALIDAPGVLRRQDGTPIPLGISLMRCLRPGYKLAVSTPDAGIENLERHLLENGIPHDAVAYRFARTPEREGLAEHELFDLHLELCQNIGPVELAVTASPTCAALAMARRVTALLFASPATARPEHRPGHRLRGWSEIEEELSGQRILRAKAAVGEDD